MRDNVGAFGITGFLEANSRGIEKLKLSWPHFGKLSGYLVVGLAAVLLWLNGCAPGLNQTLSVNRIPDLDAAELRASLGPDIKVQVQKFTDARPEKTIGDVNGRALSPASDVALAAQLALEQKLKAKGYRLSLFNSPSISGEVKDWLVQVHPGFPSSTVDASAAVKLNVYDPKGVLVYTATYKGTSTAENPFFSQERIESVLGEAMAYALEEAIRDERLRSKLADYSTGREDLMGSEGRAAFKPEVAPIPPVKEEEPLLGVM